jgi:hypothetical protein
MAVMTGKLANLDFSFKSWGWKLMGPSYISVGNNYLIFWPINIKIKSKLRQSPKNVTLEALLLTLNAHERGHVFE